MDVVGGTRAQNSTTCDVVCEDEGIAPEMLQLEAWVGKAIRCLRMPLITTSVLGNLAVIIVLLCYRTLRKNSSNMLIAQLGFADLVLGLGLAIRAIQTEVYRSVHVNVYDRRTCMLYGAPSILGMNLIQSTIIMITLDRLAVLLFPILYRRNADNVRLTVTRFVITIVVSFISCCGQFVAIPEESTISICSSGAAWNDAYRLYFMVFATFASVATIVLNMATVIAYKRRMKVSTQLKETSLVITQTFIMISYVVFWCAPTIIYTIATVLGYHSSIFGSITLILSIGCGFFASLNPFLFLWKHTEFRTYFVRSFRLRRLLHRGSKTPSVEVCRRATAVSRISIGADGKIKKSSGMPPLR